MTFFDNDFVRDNHEFNLRLLKNSTPEVLFQTLRAARWIQQNVIYTDGAIDIDATSAYMGIPVHYRDPDDIGSRGSTAGLIDRSLRLEISLSNAPHHMRDTKWVFGHELGHVLVDQKLGVCLPDNDYEERFCDYIGYMSAIPESEIEALDVVDADVVMMLSERLNVAHGTVIERLMRAGKLPPRIAYDVAMPASVSNPYYAGMVDRHVMCLACSRREEHPQSDDIMTLPTLNLTAYDVYDGYRDTHLHGATVGDHAHHKAINVWYGRWSAEAEAIYQDR